MEFIEQNVATNIARLRKAKGLTQIEFANKLSYSDKAISKWERGDSMPDIEMLAKIADIFEVTVDFLIKEHTDQEIKNTEDKAQMLMRNILVLVITCVTFFLIATIVFICSTLLDEIGAENGWIAFVAATPLCSLSCYIFSRKEKLWLMNVISMSFLVWSCIATAYCATILANLNHYWLLFLAGIPLQAIVCLLFFWRRKL